MHSHGLSGWPSTSKGLVFVLVAMLILRLLRYFRFRCLGERLSSGRNWEWGWVPEWVDVAVQEVPHSPTDTFITLTPRLIAFVFAFKCWMRNFNAFLHVLLATPRNQPAAPLAALLPMDSPVQFTIFHCPIQEGALNGPEKGHVFSNSLRFVSDCNPPEKTQIPTLHLNPWNTSQGYSFSSL